MKRYFLTALIVLSLGVSACYRDNWQVNSFEASDKLYTLVLMYQSTERVISMKPKFVNEKFTVDCINQIIVDEKLPKCMREQMLFTMGIKKP